MCGLVCRIWRVASMPLMPQHLDVHQDHVRLEPLGHQDGLAAGGRLARELSVGHHGQERFESDPEALIVVGDQYSDLVCPAHGVCSPTQIGNNAETRAPPPGDDTTPHDPPSSAARSRMERNPTPLSQDAGSPTPSSVMSMFG